MAIKACMREMIILSYGSPKKVNWIGATKIIKNAHTTRTINHTIEINKMSAMDLVLVQPLKEVLHKDWNKWQNWRKCR